MGRWPGYGGSAVTYGEMRQACGRMGKPRYRMGRRPMCGEAAESHGKPQKRMGEAAGHWKRRRYMGRPPGRMGAETALKPGIWERRRPAGSADFNEFLAETAVLSGRPLKCMGISRTWQCMSCQMRPAGSADFWQYRRRRLGMGNPPSRLSYLSLLGELCLACRAGGDLVGRPDLLRYAV